MALEEHQRAVEKYQRDYAEWKQAIKEWRTAGCPGVPPAEPPEPIANRCKVSDTTVEALAPLLQSNPRGLLLARDELSGWVGSFDQYSKGKGADAAHWLSMYDGGSLMVDRKTGIPPTIYVPSAAVSIAGGIQPGILRKALGKEHRDNGLASRLLLSFPPAKVGLWTEDDVDPADDDRLAALVERLFELQPTIDQRSHRKPVPLGLSSSAKGLWVPFHDDHAAKMQSLRGDLRAAYSKLKEIPARLALVLHLASWAASDNQTLPGPVGATSMQSGITLARWHANEARRVYAMLDAGDIDQKLLDWIAKIGEPVTTRVVQQGCRWIKTVDDAELALQGLADAGHGAWVDVPTTSSGGRPTRTFCISTQSGVYGTPENDGIQGGCVDVDTADDGEFAADDLSKVFSAFRDPDDGDEWGAA